MKLSLQHPDPKETSAELLLVATTGGTLAAGIGWIACGLPRPLCIFHTLTGQPCPTCGGTRCIAALLHGHLAEAIGWNPLVFVGLFGLILFNLYSAWVLLGHRPRLRFDLTSREARLVRAAFFLILAANWAYEIHRGA